MKLYKISLAILLGLGAMTSCNDELDVTNPNQQTTGTFGYTSDDLEECVIAAYNHTRMEGTFARVGYLYDVSRGDEVYNTSPNVWYTPYDEMTASYDLEYTQWPWRDWYYTINVCNFVISRTGQDADVNLTENMRRIKGQVLFLRGLSYYTLVNYYQNPILITDYNTYSSLSGLYGTNSTYSEVLAQCKSDFERALNLLPSKTAGGEWASGRATSGAAAGYLARVLMQQHNYSEALTWLKKIIAGDYGTYKLMDRYGDNFQEGTAYENNDESLYEVQFLDYGTQGTDDEWTPVNTSAYATQGSAIESNYGPGDYGGWADLAAAPWLYRLFKAERTTDGKLDPRLYWTLGTYETDWTDSYPEGGYGNMCYTEQMTADNPVVVNTAWGGIPIAKWTNFRTGIYEKVVTGLHDGINLRLMRYSDVLLRAAECINEVSGPTDEAIGYINQVRNRAHLASLPTTGWTADDLFEQIANVERPKEFGCEHGRGHDLIRWGWFYDEGRLTQLKQHGTYRRTTDKAQTLQPVTYAETKTDNLVVSTFDQYLEGHEFIPIYQGNLNDNPNLKGNSANNNTSNKDSITWTIHPVVSSIGINE
jgi:hypothetical protein